MVWIGLERNAPEQHEELDAHDDPVRGCVPRVAHEAEKNSWKARTEAEMDALDGKIRRLLRTRDAEIASLREALSAARGERDRARGYLEELGNELPVSERVVAAAGDCY